MRKSFLSFDGTELSVLCWDQVDNPVACVQIAHGMSENVSRYEGFARFLNENGIIVFGDDHRGHGETAKGRYGRVGSDCFFKTVQDELFISEYLKEKYNLPLVYFGHSYGSFLGQAYLQSNNVADAVVLTGSCFMGKLLPALGALVADVEATFTDEEHPSKIMAKLSLGLASKAFSEGPQGWLTRDKEVQKAYSEDETCGFDLSAGFYSSFMKGLKSVAKKKNIQKIRKDIPILIASGDEDPIGKNGKGVKKLYDKYVDAGIRDVTLKLYEGARHEILNETNKEEVRTFILQYILSRTNGDKA